ncbi:MAG TPA: CBS domain-containing protein [Caldilineae bacterium]|nr:CBS domain-containing protein [Caldilineae bacterium]
MTRKDLTTSASQDKIVARRAEKARLRVADIMTPNPVTVTPSNAVGTAISLMRAGGFRRLPVVENGRLVGIVTARDLRLASNAPSIVRERWYDNYILQHIPVGDYMTPDPITIAHDSPIAEAARLMRDHKISGLPVMNGDRLVGIVTQTDLLNFLLELLEEEEKAVTD